MRDFEKDFDFDFEAGIGVVKPQGIRLDSFRTTTYLPNRNGDEQHQVRIVAHTERIQRELSNARVWNSKKRKHELKESMK